MIFIPMCARTFPCLISDSAGNSNSEKQNFILLVYMSLLLEKLSLGSGIAIRIANFQLLFSKSNKQT